MPLPAFDVFPELHVNVIGGLPSGAVRDGQLSAEPFTPLGNYRQLR